MTIDLLKDLTKLNIRDLEFEDFKNMGDSTGYDFLIIKLKVNIINDEEKNQEADIYIKIIRKDKIKESIFCYWSLLYEEKFKNFEESEFTSVINKVRITETENEKYKHSVLLEIKDNKWGILECGSTIHLVKFQKYLNDKKIEKSTLTSEWYNCIDEENDDVLFIGIVKK